MRQDFFQMTRPELESYCRSKSHPAVHAKDLFRSAYKSLEAEPWRTPSLPKALATTLADGVGLEPPKIVESHISGYDSSVKFLLALRDGSQIEAVLMPESNRITLCVSSQVGCAQGCVFCHTGRMGLTRSLTAGEIVAQVVLADLWIRKNPAWLRGIRLESDARVTNIVFMGMGEPLDNVDAVAGAIEILTDPYGLSIGIRHIAVSTAGHLDGLKALLARVPKARIALSVHSVDEARRSKIMPINRRWPLASVLEFLKERQTGGLPGILLQYTMIKGVNDSLDEATRLAELAQGLDAKINLIPLNEVGPSRLVAPEPASIQAFRDVLHARGLRTMLRISKGQDIAAACGQLVVQ